MNENSDQIPECSPARLEQLRQLESKLGYKFNNLGYLNRALTHRSYLHEVIGGENARSYESLEFFGDAILGFLVAEKLFLSDQDLKEGDLSKIRSYIVSTRKLSKVSAEICLGEYLLISRGEEKTGGRQKPAILADLFESVIAAIYLDGGIDPVRQFVMRQFETDFEKLLSGEIGFRDSKSQLQERLHQEGLSAPVYKVIDESGPDHRKQFVVTVSSEGRILGTGSGGSKKKAEKSAAGEAIVRLSEESKLEDSLRSEILDEEND